MITVHRLNGSELVINADLIESVEATPDTVITLTTGKKIVVADAVDHVIDAVISFRRAIGVNLPRVVKRPSPDDDATSGE